MAIGKLLHRIMTVHEMQFIFLPVKGTIDVVFILRMLHVRYCTKKIVCVFCKPG